jgi:two-component system sensor histidine kinase QseC
LLLIVAGCATLLDNYFINTERLSLLDADIDSAAQAIVSSSLVDVVLKDEKKAEALISQVLGDNRIGKFFVIREQNGSVLFESGAAKLIPYGEIDYHAPWVTYHTTGDFIRVLNLPLKKYPGKILEVGAIFNRSLMINPAISIRDGLEIVGLIAIGLVIAASFAKSLLAPLRRLSEKVDEIALLSMSASVLPQISASNLDRESEVSRDEFYRLVQGLNALITRVNRGYEISRVWSYNLAHELKTPMAGISAEIEAARGKGEIKDAVASSIDREIQSISETVSAFLLWAEVEAAPARHNIHVVTLESVLKKAVSRFESRSANRIRLELGSPTELAKVAVNLAYLEIILANLISNSLNYSPSTEPIDLVLNGLRIEVIDRGGGVPPEVLARLGQPFNRGPIASKKSHGLGLATVDAISKVFGWHTQFSSDGQLGRVVLDLSAASVEGQGQILNLGV